MATETNSTKISSIEAQNVPAITEIGLTMIDDEPRCRDIDLAERLGFERPRDIRKIIERNLAEIETSGPARHHGALLHRPQGGTVEVAEYWLTEEQALLVSVLSRAQNAPAVRAMLIKVFVAWRRGNLASQGMDADARKVIGGIVKSIVHKEASELASSLLPALVEKALLERGLLVTKEYRPALSILVDRKVPTKRRRAFAQKVSSRLRRYSTCHGHPMRLSAETDRYLFHVEAITAWLRDEGDALIADHVAAIAGQCVLPFKRPR